MSQADPGKAIWTGLITDITPVCSGLSITPRWDRCLRPHPRYPANPVVDCPMLVVRSYTGDLAAQAGGTTRFDYRASLWLYKKQTPGQSHQELLEADLKTLIDFFLGNFNPTAMKAAGCEFVVPLQKVVHDELHHPLGEAKLRVSVGELVLGAKAWTRR